MDAAKFEVSHALAHLEHEPPEILDYCRNALLMCRNILEALEGK